MWFCIKIFSSYNSHAQKILKLGSSYLELNGKCSFDRIILIRSVRSWSDELCTEGMLLLVSWSFCFCAHLTIAECLLEKIGCSFRSESIWHYSPFQVQKFMLFTVVSFLICQFEILSSPTNFENGFNRKGTVPEKCWEIEIWMQCCNVRRSKRTSNFLFSDFALNFCIFWLGLNITFHKKTFDSVLSSVEDVLFS